MTEGLPHHPAWQGAAVLYLLLIGATLSYCNLICGYLWLLKSVRCWFSMTTILVFWHVFATAHQNSFDASHVSAPKAWFWDSTRISSRQRCCLAGDCEIVVVGFQIFVICLELGVASWWLNHQAREKNGITMINIWSIYIYIYISLTINPSKYDQSLGFYRNVWWSGEKNELNGEEIPLGHLFLGYGKILEAYNS